MEHPMRRKDRAMTREEAQALLAAAEYGVLSTAGEDGVPYGIPLSYVVKGQSLFFHCARTGRKLDNLTRQPLASFCAVGATQPVYDRDFSTYFESVIAEGSVQPVLDSAEKREALRLLCEKYLPDAIEHFEASLAASEAVTAVYRMDIVTISGKAKRAAK